MRANKYDYLKVIQQHYGQGWEDVSEYETDSTGTPKEYEPKKEWEKRPKSTLYHDFIEYRATGYPTRIIRRKELKATN